MDKAISTELKDVLQRAIVGNNLKVKDANMLVQALLTAIIINDDEDDEVIKKSLDKAEANPPGTSDDKKMQLLRKVF